MGDVVGTVLILIAGLGITGIAWSVAYSLWWAKWGQWKSKRKIDHV